MLNNFNVSASTFYLRALQIKYSMIYFEAVDRNENLEAEDVVITKITVIVAQFDTIRF